MNTARDIISMLEDAGSQKLFASNGHIKYKLPNGKLFTTSGTPSDVRSYKNAMALLRRELKLTHPEIAQRHRALPKNKRFAHHTMGDALALKGIQLHTPIDALTAIPGAELIEADFELVEPPPMVEPETLTYKPNLKASRDPAPPPGKAKTLTPGQLKEANRILAERGQLAMDRYIAGVRDAMCEVCNALKHERFPESVSPRNRVPEHHIFSEEDEMSSVLERARTELQATCIRIKEREEIILTTQISLDTDITKKSTLETYIEEHEMLASKAATLIADILPPVALEPKPAPPLRIHSAAKAFSNKRYIKLPYTMKDIEQKIYPILREKGLKEFGPEDILDGLALCGMIVPKRGQMQSWLFANLKNTKTQIIKIGPGKFTFKESL